MSNKNAEYYFLRGGGEMGELIRAKDWGKTALGEAADWPQSLINRNGFHKECYFDFSYSLHHYF